MRCAHGHAHCHRSPSDKNRQVNNLGTCDKTGVQKNFKRGSVEGSLTCWVSIDMPCVSAVKGKS